jgi:F-type H+-transporting ATPase subunit a
MLLNLAMADPLEHVLPHPVFGDHLTWFTNQSAMILLACVLMLLTFPRLFGRPETDAPRGWKNLFEFILQFLRDDVFRPILKDYTDAFLPFLWTLFFFILFCNIIGLFPLADIIGMLTGGRVQHLGGTATGAFTTTATLAVIAFFFIHFQGLNILTRTLMDGTYHAEHNGHGTPYGGEGKPLPVAHSPAGPEPHHGHTPNKMGLLPAFCKAVPLYFWNFAPHPFKEMGPLVDIPSWFCLLVIELIGAAVKPFALCMRLLGNMVSGHMVLAVLVALIVSAPSLMGQFAVGAPIMILDMLIQLLEVLVAFLQAYIFAFLTALFIAGAVAPEH